MDLAEFIIEVRERAGLLPRDQMAQDDTLTRFINHALGSLESGQPGGWPWLKKPDIPITLADGIGTYTFASLQGTDTWRRIRDLRILNGMEYDSLEASNVASLRDAFPSTVGSMPQGWATDGYNLIVRPVPTPDWAALVDVVIGEPDLVNPTDTPLIIDVFHDVVCDQAVYLLKRRTGDVQAAQVAQQAVTSGMVEMRGMARTQGGPAHVGIRDPWA